MGGKDSKPKSPCSTLKYYARGSPKNVNDPEKSEQNLSIVGLEPVRPEQ
jgi:hypothetical protein